MKKTLKESISKVTVCRGCRGTSFKPWLDLGHQPLANNLVPAPLRVGSVDPQYPLAIMYCTNCELVQTTHTVNPDLLFSKYLYFSSTSPVFRKHFEALAKKEFDTDKVIRDDLVVDIGSNDGILLKPFKDLGARVVGVEPAKQIADAAKKGGIPTIADYFTPVVADDIVEKHGEASLITMTNVFAHVPDLDEIMDAVKYLLADDGRFMVEVAYLPEMLKQGTFDLLYHEHVCSWHLYPMQVFFARHNMYIDEVEFVPVHGGSVRVYAKFGKPENLKHKAKDHGLPNTRLFKEFPSKVEQNKINLKTLLHGLKNFKEKEIIGYGAPAKMSTMTNYFDIGPEIISYIIEDAEAKQNHYSPGKHIKIVAPISFEDTHVDYIFIFAWNFAKSIMQNCKQKGYKGKFIIPFPRVKIL